jgi:uncharacterized membrane protein YgcG
MFGPALLFLVYEAVGGWVGKETANWIFGVPLAVLYFLSVCAMATPHRYWHGVAIMTTVTGVFALVGAAAGYVADDGAFIGVLTMVLPFYGVVIVGVRTLADSKTTGTPWWKWIGGAAGASLVASGLIASLMVYGYVDAVQRAEARAARNSSYSSGTGTGTGTYSSGGSGCGSRGGPGFRLPNGKCASWRDVR